MTLSNSSIFSDPLSDVLTVLDAKATRSTRFEGSGDWALSFPARERLKFVAVVRGSMWLWLPGATPRKLVAGDCCLIGFTSYAIASDPSLVPVDGLPMYAAGNDLVRLGGNDTVALGGGIAFMPRSASFLLKLLPTFMYVSGSSPASTAIAAVLRMLDFEATQPVLGNDVVIGRLTEVLIVQAIRVYAATSDTVDGWLGALVDPRIGRAIQCVHRDLARPWSVAGLASEASMSRAAFSAAFTQRIGQPPLAYVRTWRMTRARAELAKGKLSVSDVAARVGYSSQSAFTHAFRRTFGYAPRKSTL